MASIPVGSRRPATAAALLVLTAVLSGCLFDADFETVASPVWEPGYQWEWDVETTATYESSQGSGSSQNSENARMLVEGTAELDNGTSAYVVSHQQGMSQIYNSDRLQLVSEDGLEPLAGAYDEIECGDDIRWRAHAASGLGMLPPLRYPLNAGDTWTTKWDSLEWDVKVHSESDVETPAGDFEAVEVRFEAQDPARTMDHMFMYMEMDGFEMNLTAWYAPQARQIVKVEAENSWSQVIEGETIRRTASMVKQLTSYSLETEEGVHLESVSVEDSRYIMPRPQLEIAADQELPLNSATDNTTVTFTVQPREYRVRVSHDAVSPEMEPVPGFGPMSASLAEAAEDALGPQSSSESPSPPPPSSPPGSAYPEDWDEDELHWTLEDRDRRGFVMAKAQGGEFTVDLPAYGTFMVSVTDSPRGQAPVYEAQTPTSSDDLQCSGAAQDRSFHSSKSVLVFFEQQYEVEQETGMPEQIHVDTIDAPQTPGTLYTSYSVRPEMVVNMDEAELVLVAPDGARTSLRENDAAQIDQAGEWELVWDVEGVAGLVATGHSAQIEVYIFP